MQVSPPPCLVIADACTTKRMGHSLALQVKCVFLLFHPLEAAELRSMDKRDYQGLLGFWRNCLLGRALWTELRARVAACDYDAVSRGLVNVTE